MALTVTPVVDTVFAKLRAFILDIVPTGTIVLLGPVNRAAQPAAAHVIMTPVYRKQLRTNVHTDVDPAPSPGGSTLTEQGTRLDIQVDFYGQPAADWAAMFSTVFRDEYGVQKLAPDCAPLYADEGRMIPLVVGEEQYLDRWTVTAVLQYNPVTTVVQEFADSLSVDTINVDEAYPP